MNDTRLAELREKYKNRNLLEELAWGIYADHSGYTTKQSGEFLNWLCNMAYRALKKQPTAWVPVSERLPEKDGRYLGYIVNKHDTRIQYIMTVDFDLYDPLYNNYHFTPSDECASDNVVAWMPLPEPYEERVGRE